MWYGGSTLKTYNEVDRSFYESINISMATVARPLTNLIRMHNGQVAS